MPALLVRFATPARGSLLRRAFSAAAQTGGTGIGTGRPGPAGPATPAPGTPRRAPIRGPHSRQHHETRMVPFTPEQLYGVVSDVDKYHTFVPWCTKSKVVRKIDERHMVADLSVGFRLLSERYTSVITLDPRRAVSVDVPHSSLFDYLINDWAFHPVPANTPDAPPSTNLAFYVEFAFRNPIYQRVTDLFFEDVVKQMVSAFERECHRRYCIANAHERPQQPSQQHHDKHPCVTHPNSDRHLLHRW